MAKDKEGFLLYKDMIHTIEKLAKTPGGQVQVCELFITILQYVNDKNPVPTDPVVEIVFEPIKQQLKRDLKRYEQTVEDKKEKGALGNLKRWQPDLYKKVLSGELTLQEALFDAADRTCDVKDRTRNGSDKKIAVSDSGSVSDTVTEKEKIDSRKLKFASTLEPFLEKYGRPMLTEFYKYWGEPNKSKTKFRQEMEKTWDLERRLERWAANEKVKPGDPGQPVKLKTNYGQK